MFLRILRRGMGMGRRGCCLSDLMNWDCGNWMGLCELEFEGAERRLPSRNG